MTNEELARRAIHAESAWSEFIGPYFAMVRENYMAALTRVAASEPWESGKITKLAVAQRVIDGLEDHFKAIIAHGEIAARDKARVAHIESLPDRKRRWL